MSEIVVTFPVNATANMVDSTIVLTSDIWLNCGSFVPTSVSLPIADHSELRLQRKNDMLNNRGSDPDGRRRDPPAPIGASRQIQDDVVSRK